MGLFASGRDLGELREALEEALSQHLSSPQKAVQVRVTAMRPIDDHYQVEGKILVTA